MFNISKKTMPPPTDSSEEWYRNFYNVFSMSQMIRNMLEYSFDGMSIVHSDWEDEDMKREEKRTRQEKIIRGSEIIMKTIKDRLENDNNRIRAYMQAAMFSVSGFGLDENFPIDEKKLLSTTRAKNWNDASFGFLNLWEFSFLFGNFESIFKKELNLPIEGTSTIVNAIFKRHSKFMEYCEKSIGVNRDFCSKLWDITVEIRNLYAHQHGVLDDESMKRINLRSEKINSLMLKFIDSNTAATILNSDEDIDSCFSTRNRTSGDFYLLSNFEMNVVRNFFTQFTTAFHNFKQQQQQQQQ